MHLHHEPPFDGLKLYKLTFILPTALPSFSNLFIHNFLIDFPPLLGEARLFGGKLFISNFKFDRGSPLWVRFFIRITPEGLKMFKTRTDDNHAAPAQLSCEGPLSWAGQLGF